MQVNKEPMNKQEDKVETTEADLKTHYEFDYAKAKPNRFAARLAQEQVMVVLDPDMAAAAQNLPNATAKRPRKLPKATAL